MRWPRTPRCLILSHELWPCPGVDWFEFKLENDSSEFAFFTDPATALQPPFPSSPKPIRDFLRHLEEQNIVSMTVVNHAFQRQGSAYEFKAEESPCVFRLTQKVTKKTKLTQLNLGAALCWKQVKASTRVKMLLKLK